MNILQDILLKKKKEILLIDNDSLLPTTLPSPCDFFPSLKRRSDQDPVRLIAEIKKASPSKGVIREEFDPVALAKTFEQQGAAAISVLTDEQFFQGKLEYITAIKEVVQIPVLRKDFIISEKQIEQSQRAGADAILLIVRVMLMLSDNRPDKALLILSHFLDQARDRGLECLVEVHDLTELKIAVTSGARIIGINNRNLDTFEVDLSTTTILAERLPTDWKLKNCLVSESGMMSKADIPAGVDAVLVGEGLVGGSLWL